MIDSYGRKLTYLRLSVTDRCNLLCLYCKVPDIPRAEKLSFDEILRIVRVAAGVGVTKVRLTGGEPTLRRDIVDIVKATASTPGIEKTVMTSNGLALGHLAPSLARAGLSAVNISCDSIDSLNFHKITGGGDLARVVRGIDAALNAGLRVKINCVVIAGRNDHEVIEIVEFGRVRGLDVRFIEYMPSCPSDGVHEHNSFTSISSLELRFLVSQRYKLYPIEPPPNAGPAEMFQIAGSNATVGFISAMSNPFCENCNRIRVTSAGQLRSCLLTGGEYDLAGAMRSGVTDKALEEMIQLAFRQRPPVYQIHQSGVINMRAIGG